MRTGRPARRREKNSPGDCFSARGRIPPLPPVESLDTQFAFGALLYLYNSILAFTAGILFVKASHQASLGLRCRSGCRVLVAHSKSPTEAGAETGANSLPTGEPHRNSRSGLRFSFVRWLARVSCASLVISFLSREKGGWIRLRSRRRKR